MAKYVVKYQNDGNPFWLASGTGDPARTLIIANARTFRNKDAADAHRIAVNAKWLDGEDMGKVMYFQRIKGSIAVFWASDDNSIHFHGFDICISFDQLFTAKFTDNYSQEEHEYKISTNSPLGLFSALNQRFIECCNVRFLKASESSLTTQNSKNIFRAVEFIFFTLIPRTISHE